MLMYFRDGEEEGTGIWSWDGGGGGGGGLVGSGGMFQVFSRSSDFFFHPDQKTVLAA